MEAVLEGVQAGADKMRRFLCVITVLLLSTAAWAASKKPATVKLVEKNITAVITFEKGRKLKLTSKGTLLAPGTHFTKTISIFKKDDKGRTWEIRCTGSLGGLRAVIVAPGQEKIMMLTSKLGFTLNARLVKGETHDTIQVTFRARGPYDESYVPGAWCGRKAPPAPGIVIRNQSGKVLHRGRFRSARASWNRYEWKVPRGFKARITVELKPVMGPFQFQQTRSTFDIPRNDGGAH